MERLSSLDASFLHVESASAHMHVGWLATLDLRKGDQALDVDAVRAQLRSRMHLVPRFRQRVRRAAGGLGPPGWLDDPDFDLDDHLTIQDGPLDAGGLARLANAFFSEQLPRGRPLWHLHLVPRLGARGAAVMGKVHHAMVDGIAAVQLGVLLFDAEPDAAPGHPVPWSPHSAGLVRLAVDAARDTALDQLRLAGRAAQLGLDPGRSARLAGTMRRAAFSLAEDVRHPAPESYLNVPIGARRQLVGTALPLARLTSVKEATGAKLNDVVLATVAGALARLAGPHGGEAQDVRAMVPASVRSDAREAQGNQISFVFVDLPVAAPPGERVRLVRERTAALKEDGRIAGSHQVMQLLGLLPGPVQGQAARLATSPRLYNLTVSNVPGPPIPLYLAGAEVRSILPVIPIPDRHALAIGALSYAGRLHLSAYMDPEALPGGRRLPVMLKDAFEELDVAARHGRAA